MKIVTACVAAAFVVLGATACSIGREISRVSTTQEAVPWKDVIRDWYPDQRFDRPHGCAAVRAAIEYLSSHVVADPPAGYDEMRALERRVCR